jgi:ketosteroid isomerase-like protein
MSTNTVILIVCIALLVGCAVSSKKLDLADLQQQVADTEQAFANTMADRDYPAFKTFLSDESVFFSGTTALHGKQQVAAAWKSYFEQADAPFSWKPEQVEVLDSGTLALSTGPVRDSTGKLVATFSSIWRRDSDGRWRIIFDKGNTVCEGAKRESNASPGPVSGDRE